MMTAKPSEIRAASKAGRAAVKAEREKQERMLKEQQESQMKMNKIRAEIEAIKKKEKADNEKGTLGSDYKHLTGKYIPYTNGKHSDIDDAPFPISSDRELEKLSPQRNRVIFVRRGSVIAPDKIPDKKMDEEKQKMDSQRKKLNEARDYFEEGHRLCWKFQDSHSALGEYRKALFIREGFLGKYHEETGITYYWVGRSLLKLKEHDEALVALSRAKRIFERVTAHDSKYLNWTETAIADVFLEMDNHDVDFNTYKAALDSSISHERTGDVLRQTNNSEQGKESNPHEF